jgi:hypothetical protein
MAPRGDPCWTDERDRLLIEAADALHECADIGEDLWHRLAGLFREEQLPDLLMLAGWYHAIARDRCRPADRYPPPQAS